MFAENDRISHRQLFRQIVMSLVAPFLLCLAGWHDMSGVNGLAGIVIVAVILGFYVIFLVRLAPAYEHMEKYMGKIQHVVIAAAYFAYIVFTAAFILDLISSLVGTWLLYGVNDWWIRIAVAIFCAAGSHYGMQKRARMAEVSFLIVAGALCLLVVFAFAQGNLFSVQEFFRQSLSAARVGRGSWQLLCGFLPLTLLPFLLCQVAKASGSGKTVFGAVVFLLVFLAVLLVLLPLALGWDRMTMETVPVLPLLAGTNLPGDIMARFDVIWISLILYALLYSLGSLYYYANYVTSHIAFSVNRWVVALLVWVISVCPFAGYRIAQYYPMIVAQFGVPILFGLTFYIYIWYRRRV